MENLYIRGHGGYKENTNHGYFLYINLKRLYDKMYDDDAPP